MKLANAAGRSVIVVGDTMFDVSTESEGRFGPDLTEAYERWDELRHWADNWSGRGPLALLDADLGAPSPHARQIVGIGLNYHDHAEQLGLPVPDRPVVFGKFPTCLMGPRGSIVLNGDSIDWEAELVVVIGRVCHDVAEHQAWDHVAGLTIGQDISDRRIQLMPPIPQLTFAKSAQTFGPTGPLVVTIDELGDIDDLELICRLNDEVVQRALTSDLIFGVPEVVSYVSSVVDLLPGDLIFMGTPAGCGLTAEPPRYLRPGDRVVTEVPGIGVMSHQCVASDAPTEKSEGAPCTSN